MSVVLTTTLLSAGAGLLKGAGSVWSKAEESAQQQSKLKKEIAKLDSDLDYLEKSYTQNQTALTNQKDRNVKNLNWNINQTSALRDTSAQNASISNVAKQDSMYRELSSVIASVADTEGAFNQSLAVTGARNSGTSSIRQRQIQREAREKISSAQQNLSLTSKQMAEEAYNNYWDSSARMESYANSIEDTKAAYAEQMASLKLQYEQNKADIEYNKELAQEAYDDAEYTPWEMAFDILTLGVSGASDTYSTYTNAKKVYDAETHYESIGVYDKE